MYCLAFDCSASSMSVALMRNQEALEEINFIKQSSHSEKLVATIKSLLDTYNLNFKDLSLVVATNGPGSYTGTRVALSVLKMIKIATQKTCLTVNSCDVVAHKYFPQYHKINVVIEAGANEVYYAKYASDGNILKTEIASTILNLDDAKKSIKTDEFLCGSANKNFTYHDLKSNQDDFISAIEVANYGIKINSSINQNNDIFPIYLRDPKISKRKN